MRYVLYLLPWLMLALPLRAATIKVDRSGKVPLVTLVGEMTYEDGERFATALGDAKEGMVVLASPGGNMLAGLRIGQLIRARGFTTFVPDQMFCASACAYVWLGGRRRLMQPTARIGFHATYIVRRGRPRESGAGNALVGAYLSRLGLGDAAILYISSAAPEDIQWLTEADARRLGIEVSVVPASRSGPAPDPVPDLRDLPEVRRTPEPASPTVTALDGRASAFVDRYFAAWSETNTSALQAFDGFYASSVTLYGRSLLRSEVMRQKTAFSLRWPERVYAVRGPSMALACDAAARTCIARGIVDWETRAPDRNERSTGAANFELLLDFNGATPLILSENGSVVSRAVSSTR